MFPGYWVGCFVTSVFALVSSLLLFIYVVSLHDLRSLALSWKCQHLNISPCTNKGELTQGFTDPWRPVTRFRSYI